MGQYDQRRGSHEPNLNEFVRTFAKKNLQEVIFYRLQRVQNCSPPVTCFAIREFEKRFMYI